MRTSGMALFGLRFESALSERVAARLGITLAPHEEREFEWGQHKSRPTQSVRGADAYVVASLHGDAAYSVNDKLCRLLFFLATLRDADAARVTAIVPFLCYSRKDRRTKQWDPVTTRYVAQLFEAVGVDRVATLEVHNPAAFQNAFRCRTTHIDAAPLVADVLARDVPGERVVVMSPDAGGVKRARHYADAMARSLGHTVPTAFVEKQRSEDVVTTGLIVGDVAGRDVVLVDDLIAAGTTLARAAAACRAAGARTVVAAAVHGTFVAGASTTLSEAPLDRIYVLDHVPPTALDASLLGQRVHLIDCADLLASTIRELHGGSV